MNANRHFLSEENSPELLRTTVVTLSTIRWRRFAYVLGACWLILMLQFVSIKTAKAHTEGKMQLSAHPAGPFKMTVFTSPDPAITGDIHIAALIFMADDARPVLDADVTIQIQPTVGDGPAQSVKAVLGDAENKLLYEAIADISSPGSYLVSVSVEDRDGQSGDASFELEVVSAGGFNWLYLIPIIIAGLIAAFWIINRARSQESSTSD